MRWVKPLIEKVHSIMVNVTKRNERSEERIGKVNTLMMSEGGVS